MADERRNKPTIARRVELRREDCGPDAPPDLCRCHGAVSRAYASMLLSGAPDSVALEAAVRVYRYHHPEAAAALAQHTVETWVVRGTVH